MLYSSFITSCKSATKPSYHDDQIDKTEVGLKVLIERSRHPEWVPRSLRAFQVWKQFVLGLLHLRGSLYQVGGPFDAVYSWSGPLPRLPTFLYLNLSQGSQYALLLVLRQTPERPLGSNQSSPWIFYRNTEREVRIIVNQTFEDPESGNVSVNGPGSVTPLSHNKGSYRVRPRRKSHSKPIFTPSDLSSVSNEKESEEVDK